MRRLFVLVVFLTLFSISVSHAQNPVETGMLYIFSSRNLPADVKPLYVSGDTVLAFGPEQPNAGYAGTLAPGSQSPGQYYLLRVFDNRIFEHLSVPYITIGDVVVFKAHPDQAENLSQYGWGLTRLTPVVTSTPPVPEAGLPSITVADSNIIDLVSVITPESSRQLIAELSGLPTRYSYAAGCRQAEQYVYNRFNGLQLATSYYNFQYSGTSMRDVIGQVDGIAYPESIIIVCAHLDCTSENPQQLAPGAEDNGTGTAAVLEAARALAHQPMDLSVRFVTFSGEEQGLIGSDYYAAYVQSQGEHIVAVINVDMVGYSGNYAQDMHIFSDPGSYALGALGARILADYTSLDTIPHYASSPTYGSDHYPFATRGYRAMFFIDAWYGYDWYPYYHTTADTVGNLNLNQQAAIGQAVAAMAATLARPHFAPPYLPGDANGSGEVNGLDAVFLVNYLKGGGPAPDPLLRGDANGDCAANGLDVVYLVNFFKGGPAPFRGNCP